MIEWFIIFFLQILFCLVLFYSNEETDTKEEIQIGGPINIALALKLWCSRETICAPTNFQQFLVKLWCAVNTASNVS